MILCLTCNDPLDVAGDASSRDCGGDCLRCMANLGDDDAQTAMRGHIFPYKTVSDPGRYGLPAAGEKVRMVWPANHPCPCKPAAKTVAEVSWFPSLWFGPGVTKPAATVWLRKNHRDSRPFWPEEWSRDDEGRWIVTVT